MNTWPSALRAMRRVGDRKVCSTSTSDDPALTCARPPFSKKGTAGTRHKNSRSLEQHPRQAPGGRPEMSPSAAQHGPCACMHLLERLARGKLDVLHKLPNKRQLLQSAVLDLSCSNFQLRFLGPDCVVVTCRLHTRLVTTAATATTARHARAAAVKHSHADSGPTGVSRLLRA
jgi:hypothetical protein